MAGMNAALALLAAICVCGCAAYFALIDGDDDGEGPSASTEEKSAMAGRYMTFELSGGKSGIMDSFEIEGTATYTYLAYNEDRDAFFMESRISYTRTTTYGSGIFSRTVSEEYANTDSYWTDETESHKWTDTGETVAVRYDGKSVECEVWKTAYTDSNGYRVYEKRCIGTGDDWVTYEIVMTKKSRYWNGSTTAYTYTLTDYGYDAKIDADVKVSAYTEDGIAVSGTGSYTAGSTVTLSATASEGYEFKGWYDRYDGRMLSSDEKYSFQVSRTDVSVYALNTTVDVAGDANSPVGLTATGATSGTWAVYDRSMNVVATVSGSAAEYAFADAGEYYAVFDGTASDGSAVTVCADVLIDGTVTRKYVWEYGGESYTLSLEIRYDDYRHFVDLTSPEDRVDTYNGTRNPSGDLRFAITESDRDDRYLAEIATYIESETKGWSQQETANMTLAFAQCIKYRYDLDSTGYEEYFKYPLETLFDQDGDCEDSSFLFCAIMREMGYDTSLFLFNGHMAAGVALDSFTKEKSTSSSVSRNTVGWKTGGISYYYCETTADGWRVGQVPVSVVNSFVAALHVGAAS